MKFGVTFAPDIILRYIMTQKFNDGRWSRRIDVADFVYSNITPYEGDASFLQGPTERTKKLWNKCLEALAEERENGGVRAIDAQTISTITSHAAGYIDKENELIVGLQTDELLKRAIKPFGGLKVVEKACQENGVELDPKVKEIFTHYRKTHNDGVFDVYTEEIRKYRSLGFLTGLPDNYSRGRIIGDYRRLALYGIDRLIEAKKEDLKNLTGTMTRSRITLREEVAEQIKALKALKEPCSVTLTSDSKYVVDGITKGWAESWKENGWRKKDKKPALNPDLWDELLTLTHKHRVEIIWVRGHDGHPENEECDKMAVAESQKFI